MAVANNTVISRKTKLQRSSIFLLPSVLVISLFIAGCGGGGGGSSSSGGSSTTAYYVASLPGGQSGALALTTQPGTDNVTGAFVISPLGSSPSVRRADTGSGLAAGAFDVGGTVSSNTFSLTYATTSSTITGSLPSGNGSSAFTLSIGGTNYAGTLTVAPSQTTADSALAGNYVITSLTNPVTNQTISCPGTLAFSGGGASGNDDCVASEDTTVTSSGSITTTANSQTGSTGSIVVVGNILYFNGTETGNSEVVDRYYTFNLSSGTLTLKLLRSSQSDEAAQAADEEVTTLVSTM